jgi:hypothetical protein
VARAGKVNAMTNRERKSARPEGRAQGSCEGTTLETCDRFGFIAVALLLASGLVAWLVMAWG